MGRITTLQHHQSIGNPLRNLEIGVQDLKVEMRSEDDWSVIAVAGDLDVYTAPRLREAMINAVADGSRKVAIDLTSVGFLDSTGLAAMVGGLKLVEDKGGQVVLLRPNAQIRRILVITDLAKVLPMCEKLSEAMGC